jgi:tRNA A-37 threonylcarbamoyl transferase component Bud32
MTRCPRCQRRLPPSSECPVHGRPSTVVSVVEDSLPLVVPPKEYSLDRLIAAGGSALVYSVTHESGTPAILKWGRWRDRDIHERFEREARILSRLGKPLTPTLVGRNDPDDWPYLLMEAVSGETLAAWMSRSGENGALGEIVAILMRLARVLQQIHDAGYIHRDLKPENVVVGTNDTRILDFGLAAAEGEGLTQAGAVLGTVHYIAPEQVRTGAAIDRRADLYAFGVLAYEMIAGQPPFIGERRAIEYQHQVVRPPSLREMRQVPPELEAVVLHCLAKQPEARPQTASAIAIELGNASAYIQTLKGVGHSTAKKSLGTRDRVVLVWIEGGDPITISRAITDVHGIVVRSRPGSVLAAFASQFHDAPLAVAVGTCRELAHDKCRIVVHVTTTLVRRSAQGKPAFYGRDVEVPANWTPSTIFSGLVLTAAAADLSPATVVPAADVPGFFRDGQRRSTDSTDVRRDVALVGRTRMLQEIGAIATAGGVLVGVSGAEGTGKSRVLAALVERLQAQREVIAVRGRRRLSGDRPDDERLFDALGGSDLPHVLAEAAARRAIVVIDDVHHFSQPVREQLLRTDVATTRVIASRTPMFEVTAGMTSRLAIELPALQYSDAERLLRELLEPARLIPDVLLQRLSIRAGGNPGLLVALARDIKHRGGIRRQEGTDDWYVAADEIDTLLAAPSAAWLAARGLEGLAVELAPIVRTAAALGPKFDAAEVAAILEIELPDAEARLRRVVRDGVFAERNGWYEFVDAGLQDAIYEHAVDERALVHARAQRYWLASRTRNLVGWLARVGYHASGSGDAPTGAACSSMLARYARERGELDLAADLEQRAMSLLMTAAPGAVADAVRTFDEAHGLSVVED